MKSYKLYPLILLALAPSSWADEKLEHIIVTATQQADSRLQIPMSVSVLNAEDLEMVQQVHASEIFQRVSGTWISRGNGQESLTALRSPVLTGAGSCGAFFMASDGISLRAPGFCNVNQLFDANTEQAERIEVLKGPATALYGSGAMHGLINVITPRPRDQEQHQFGIEAGPHDYRRGKYRYDNQFGSQGLMLAVNYTDDGGYKRSSGFDQTKLSLRHTYDGNGFSTDTIFTGADLDQDTAGFIQEGYKAYEKSQFKKLNPNPDAYRNADSMRLQSTISFPLSDTNLFTLTPYLRDNDMEFLQHYLPWQSVEKNGHDSMGISGKIYHNATWIEWVSGIDFDYTDGWLKETQEEPFRPTQPTGVHYDYQVDAISTAAWTQLDWDLARDWNLVAGLRYEYTDYDYDNKTEDGPACEPGVIGCRFYRPADREDDFNNWSFNLGLLYDFRPNQAVFARLSRGFRAPQATEMYRLQSGQERADLDSEELKSIELGIRGNGDNWEYELGSYYTEKDDVIFQDADRRNVSDASTKHYGLDFSLRWLFSENFDLALDGNIARHEYDSDITLLGSSGDINGNQIDTSPESFGSLRLGWDFLPQYRAELEWVHMAEYYLEPDNNHEYDGHDLLNLRINGALTKNLSAGIRVTNLTDEDYAERADFGFGNYRYFVGEPRSVYASLEYRFAP